MNRERISSTALKRHETEHQQQKFVAGELVGESNDCPHIVGNSMRCTRETY
jgi:hypothetical protein